MPGTHNTAAPSKRIAINAEPPVTFKPDVGSDLVVKLVLPDLDHDEAGDEHDEPVNQERPESDIIEEKPKSNDGRFNLV